MPNIKLFDSKKIRTVWYEKNQKRYFCIKDAIIAFTDIKDVKDRLKKLRKYDKEVGKKWKQLVTPIVMDTAGGKQKVNCADAANMLRIIQSIRSPKAESFKRWLIRYRR